MEPAWQDSYGLARWLGYMTEHELDALKEIARLLPANPLVVNIGAGAGTVTLGILEERPDALIFSIDLNTNNDEISTNEHLRLQEAGWGDTGHVLRVWGDSKVVGKRWRWPVDLVVVDGDHTAPGLQGDILTWRRHVKPGGYMLFHDYTKKVWPDVKPTVDAAFPYQQPVFWVDTLIGFRIGPSPVTPQGACASCSADCCEVPSC